MSRRADAKQIRVARVARAFAQHAPPAATQFKIQQAGVGLSMNQCVSDNFFEDEPNKNLPVCVFAILSLVSIVDGDMSAMILQHHLQWISAMVAWVWNNPATWGTPGTPGTPK